MTYAENLNAVKSRFPFEKWKTYVDNGLEQYTDENCEKARTIMDRLIASLVRLGPDAKEAQKVAHFETAVKAFNQLNEDSGGCLIETGEREELFEIFELIAAAAGIDSRKYGAGEGIASEWRDW
jgi:hypothetical protein